MGEEIILEKDHKKIVAANTYLAFHRPLVKNFFITFMAGGLIALAFLGFSFYYQFPGIEIPLKAAIFFGLLSFGAYFYIFHFVASYFRARTLNAGENYFKFFDPEVAQIVGRTDLENPDLMKIFQQVMRSPKVAFILNEGQVNQKALDMLLSGMPESVSGFLVFKNIMVDSFSLALRENRGFITAADFFWGFLSISKNLEKFLLNLELEEEDMENLVFWANRLYLRHEYPKTTTEKLQASAPGIGSGWASGYTLTLDRFSSEVGNQGNFSIECREGIVHKIEDTLSKEAKNNCVLVGPVGVGKTSLVYGLARRIYWGETVPTLSHYRVLTLDLGSILSSSKQKGDFQEILTRCLNEAVNAGNVILFIDEIQNLFSGESEGTINATDVLAPYLESSSLKIIGTSSQADFQTFLAPKNIFASNFEKVEVGPTNKNETIKILEDLALQKSHRYNIGITYFAIKEIYLAAEKYATTKSFPARAADLLEEIFSSARNTHVKVINHDSVYELLKRDLGVPIGEAEGNEKEVLLNLEEKIHTHVIGQKEAVKAVSDALKRARTKGTNAIRPIGTFLFLGPTGVGKTELAKALAWSYFGAEDKLVRVDLNEYQAPDSVERFLGKKIIGRNELEGGDFVKKVKEDPFSVVLLDEIEKAHPNILDLLLQALDEGYIIDGMGEKVQLTNNIIIATSNAGALDIRDGVQNGTPYELLKDKVMENLQQKGIFKPEFLNRFDGLILFGPLDQSEILEVANLMFTDIQKEYASKGYKIELEPGLLESLAQKGYHPEMGARPMRRVFQDVLETYLADEILKGNVKKGEVFLVAASQLGPA